MSCFFMMSKHVMFLNTVRLSDIPLDNEQNHFVIIFILRYSNSVKYYCIFCNLPIEK